MRDEVVQEFSEDDVVFLSLSVETNASAERLAEYASGENFDWTFAVATSDMLAGLTNEYGRNVANPPQQPHFIMRPDGSVTHLMFGTPPAAITIERIQAEGGL